MAGYADVPSWIKAHGVIVVRNAPLRTAPTKFAKPLVAAPGGYTSLHRGANVDIIGENAGYYEIYTDDGPLYVAKWMIKLRPRTSYSSSYHVPPKPRLVRHTYQLLPAVDYQDRVPFLLTQNHWFKVKDASGYIHFKEAAVVQGQFSADVAINGTIIKPTDKPVRIDFAVTVYDEEKTVLARDRVSLYDVAADGGSYVLIGPTVLDTGNGKKPYSCDIHLAGIWTQR